MCRIAFAALRMVLLHLYEHGLGFFQLGARSGHRRFGRLEQSLGFFQVRRQRERGTAFIRVSLHLRPRGLDQVRELFAREIAQVFFGDAVAIGYSALRVLQRGPGGLKSAKCRKCRNPCLNLTYEAGIYSLPL